MIRFIKFQTLLTLLALIFLGCEPQPEPEPDSYALQVFATAPGLGGDAWSSGQHWEGKITELIPNAKVYLYGNEEDYLLRQNHLHEGVTDEKGFFYKEFNAPYAFWVYVEKEGLNNNRFSIINRLNGVGCNGKIQNYVEREVKVSENNKQKVARGEIYVGEGTLFPVLTPNIAKLNLTVYNNGTPVEGAMVVLYLSQADYEQDIPAYFDVEELKVSYGIFDYDYLKQYGRPCLEESFVQNTDKDGQAYFQNLEPRQYWFKIVKDGKTNEAGTIDTGTPLPNNPNVTTSLTVGIN